MTAPFLKWKLTCPSLTGSLVTLRKFQCCKLELFQLENSLQHSVKLHSSHLSLSLSRCSVPGWVVGALFWSEGNCGLHRKQESPTPTLRHLSKLLSRVEADLFHSLIFLTSTPSLLNQENVLLPNVKVLPANLGNSDLETIPSLFASEAVWRK